MLEARLEVGDRNKDNIFADIHCQVVGSLHIRLLLLEKTPELHDFL